MDPQLPTASTGVSEPTTSHREDPAFSLRKIFPSRIALLLLLIPLVILDFYLYLVREGKIAEEGFQPPTGPVERGAQRLPHKSTQGVQRITHIASGNRESVFMSPTRTKALSRRLAKMRAGRIVGMVVAILWLSCLLFPAMKAGRYELHSIFFLLWGLLGLMIFKIDWLTNPALLCFVLIMFGRIYRPKHWSRRVPCSSSCC